jgi:hypothetical protein
MFYPVIDGAQRERVGNWQVRGPRVRRSEGTAAKRARISLEAQALEPFESGWTNVVEGLFDVSDSVNLLIESNRKKPRDGSL